MKLIRLRVLFYVAIFCLANTSALSVTHELKSRLSELSSDNKSKNSKIQGRKRKRRRRKVIPPQDIVTDALRDQSDTDLGDEDGSDYDNESESDDSDCSDESDDEEKGSNISLLSRNTKTLKGRSACVMQFFSRNHTKLIIALAIIVFHREIFNYLLRTSFFSKTRILKIVLLIDLLRKFGFNGGSKQHDSSDGNTDSNINRRYSLLPPPFNILQDLLSPPQQTMMNFANTYNPSPTQHYMFECINDRYFKDKMAYQKILHTPSPEINAKQLNNKNQLRYTNRRSLSKMYTDLRNQNNTHHKDKSANNFIESRASKTNNTCIVIELRADPSMSQIAELRDTVSFILSMCDHTIEKEGNISDNSTDKSKKNTDFQDKKHNPGDFSSSSPSTFCNDHNIEVIILLESPGGVASSYGLAANQLQRLRNYNGMRNTTELAHSSEKQEEGSNHSTKIKLTICVDKVAASGGYMMACQATPNSLLAAPFAMVGSIGVVSQSVNFYSLLKDRGVLPITFKAPGEGKAPITSIAEITDEGIAVVQSMIDKTHSAFRKFVAEGRGEKITDMDKVATGEVYMGTEALELGLIDRIVTSDEYIQEKVQNGDLVLKLKRYEKPRIGPLNTLFGPVSPSTVPSRNHQQNSILNFFDNTKRIIEKLDLLISGPRFSTFTESTSIEPLAFMGLG